MLGIHEAQLLEKYGALKPARYFVRTPVDLAEVAETVYRQIWFYSTTRETPAIMKLARCVAMPVPNTLSSMILSVNIPESILACNGIRNPDPRVNEIASQLTDAPIMAHRNGNTCLSKRISDFFDLYTFHHHVKSMLQTTTEGTKLWAAKRSASLNLALSDSSDYFEITIVIPGIFFANSETAGLGERQERA